MRSPGRNCGFSLMEVLIGMFLSTILMSGIILLISQTVSTYRLQLSQGHIEASSRYARDVLISHISQAGYQPEPWRSGTLPSALTTECMDGDSLAGDQLGLQRYSTSNCFGNKNPITDADGKPAFHLLQTRFKVSKSRNLAMTCRYGSGPGQLATQINNFGLVEGVESMQVLFAEDRDGDNIPDSWVNAGSWDQEANIRAVKIALLLSTNQTFGQSAHTRFTLLDESIKRPSDGRLRKVSTITSTIRGRLK